MESASQPSVRIASQPSADAGSRTDFGFAHTGKLAGNPPTFDEFGRFSSSGRAYRGGGHPPATGDGHRP